MFRLKRNKSSQADVQQARQDKQIIFYNRTAGCPYSTIAKIVLEKEGLSFREIMIDLDRRAGRQVEKWTGYRVVPTLVIAKKNGLQPLEPPAPLAEGKSPRGVNRGTLISEPNQRQLRKWLKDNGLR